MKVTGESVSTDVKAIEDFFETRDKLIEKLLASANIQYEQTIPFLETDACKDFYLERV